MPARPPFEARIGDRDRPLIGQIDAVRTARAFIALAEPGEGRAVDRDFLRRRMSAKNALLAIEKGRIAYHQIADLGTDARAIAVGDAHPAKHQPLDGRSLPAQHKRRLALARRALEDRSARLDRLEGDHPARLHRALAIDAGRDQDRRGAHPDRLHGIVDRRETLAGFLDRERRAALLRGSGDGKREGEQWQERAHRELLYDPKCAAWRGL